MPLLANELRARLEGARGIPLPDQIAQARFVDPVSGIRWYPTAIEGDRFFGVVVGTHAVIGEFTLEELEGIGEGTEASPWVSLDPTFEPMSLYRLAQVEESLLRELPEDGLIGLQE